MDSSGLIAAGLTTEVVISVVPLMTGSEVAATGVLEAGAWLDPCGLDPLEVDPPGWVAPGSRAAPLSRTALSVGITGSCITSPAAGMGAVGSEAVTAAAAGMRAAGSTSAAAGMRAVGSAVITAGMRARPLLLVCMGWPSG